MSAYQSVQNSAAGYSLYSSYGVRVGRTGREARLARIRRERERARMIRRAKALILAVAAAIISVTVLSGFTGIEDQKKAVTRYYAAVTVDKGDTLWEIASKYYSAEEGSMHSYVRDIITFNHLGGYNVSFGQTVVIPYYSAENNA